jgi:hypothetical protein
VGTTFGRSDVKRGGHTLSVSGPHGGAPCLPAPDQPIRRPPAKWSYTQREHATALGKFTARRTFASRVAVACVSGGTLFQQQAHVSLLWNRLLVLRTHVASVVMSPTPAESSSRAAAITCRKGGLRLLCSEPVSLVVHHTASILYVGCGGGAMRLAMLLKRRGGVCQLCHCGLRSAHKIDEITLSSLANPGEMCRQDHPHPARPVQALLHGFLLPCLPRLF